MMFDLGFSMILGHLLGDYVFQNDAMAQNKAKKGLKGSLYCLLHCIEYSLVVTFVMWLTGSISSSLFPYIAVIAFVSHYPIDRISFAKWWLRHYNRKNLPLSPDSISPEGIMTYDAGVFFYWFVYTLVDNTFHLALMSSGLIILDKIL